MEKKTYTVWIILYQDNYKYITMNHNKVCFQFFSERFNKNVIANCYPTLF